MESAPKNRWLDLAAAGLIGLCLLSLMPVRRMIAGQNDFVHFYIGGLLFGTPDLHSPEANQAKQRELIGGALDNSYFIRPTFYGFFLKPLAWMPYRTAYIAFQSLSLFCFGVFLYFFTPQFPRLPVLSAMSAPLLANFINGQDVVLLVCAVTLAMVAVRRGHDVAAGLLLALCCCFKFHLLAVIPVALLLYRKWRVIAGGAIGGVVLAIITAFGGGMTAARQVISLLRNPVNSPQAEIMPNLRGLVVDFAGENLPLLLVACLLVVGLVIWLCVQTRDFECAMGYCLIGGLLTGFHSYLQDCLLVLLAAALLMPKLTAVPVRNLLLFATTPPLYVILMCGRPWSALVPLFFVAILAAAALTGAARAPCVAIPRALARGPILQTGKST